MRRKIIPYNPKLKEIARNLRSHGSLSEVLLWGALKGKQMRGYDFHRQKPIDKFIVDFYCPNLFSQSRLMVLATTAKRNMMRRDRKGLSH